MTRTARRRRNCASRGICAAWLALIASGLPFLPSPAAAQNSSSEVLVEFSIPEQSMAQALKAFAKQSGKQVIFYSRDTARLRAGPVRGRFAERDALKRILRTSGLDFVYINSRTIGIGRRDAHGRFISGFRSPPEVPRERQTEESDSTIIVTGRLLDAELSTEAKREARQVVDVLTSNQRSQLPDKNIAESLARLPGVSVVRNGETGDGAFISIRGLDSALSNIQFDGVNSGQANPGNRSIPLEGITADNVREIRVSKTLLPQDEGVGIGGQINIISRTPLDDGYDRFSVEASLRHGEFSRKDGFDATVTISKIFDDDFGANLSASFRRRYIHNYEIDAINSFLSHVDGITNANGEFVSPKELFDLGLTTQNQFRNFTPGYFKPEQIVFEQHTYQILQQKRDTLSLSGAIDWRPSDTTSITLIGRYGRTEIDGVEWAVGFDEDGGDFSLDDGRLASTWLDLELDYGAQLEESAEVNATGLLRGVTELNDLTLSWLASYSRASSIGPQTDIDFSSNERFDRGREPLLTYQPFRFANTYFPVSQQAILRDDEFSQAMGNIAEWVENTAFRSYEMTQTNNRYAASIDISYNADANIMGGSISHIRFGGKFERSDRYALFDYYQSTSTRLNVDGTFNGPDPGNALGTPLSEFASLKLRPISFAPIGSPLAALGLNSIPVFGVPEFRAFARTFQRSFQAADYPFVLADFFDGREDVFGVYGQFEFEVDKLRLIGGVRVERYKGTFRNPLNFQGQINLLSEGEIAREVNLAAPAVQLDTVLTTAANTEILPRLVATYDIDPEFKIRFGAGNSIARPTYSQLGRATSVSVLLDVQNPDQSAILPGVTDLSGMLAAGGLQPEQISNVAIAVFSGNSELKNARSFNLDLSFEWYPTAGTNVSLGLFSKNIRNFMFLGAEAADGTLDAGLVESMMSADAVRLLETVGGISALGGRNFSPTLAISRPTNGSRATLKGFELGLSHRFSWAPGILQNAGLYGNLTYTDSNAKFVVSQALPEDSALVVLGFYDAGDTLFRESTFFRAPTYIGNGALFYDDGIYEGAISFSYQSGSFLFTDDFGLDQFTAPYTQLDLFLGYRLPVNFAKLGFFFEVADLLDHGLKATDLQTVGRRRVAFDEASFNGREFRFGIRGQF